MMGLFSWFKQDRKIMEVPAALPDTIMDKVGTTETLPGAKQLIPLPQVGQPASPDTRVIPPEIAAAANAKPIPMQPQGQVETILKPGQEPGAMQTPPQGQLPPWQQFPPGYFPGYYQYPGYPNYYPPYPYAYGYGQMMPGTPGADNQQPMLQPSFFGELERRYPQDKGAINEYISSDLISRLHEYHSTTRPNQNFMMGGQDADSIIYRKLVELKELESEWLMRKREVESAQMILSEKEEEIQSKLEEFRNSLMTADKFKLFHRRAPLGNEFVLKDGLRLASIQDMMFALLKMPDEVFRHHVTGDRNDFATWIRYVFNSERLATHIFPAKSKEDLLALIKNF